MIPYTRGDHTSSLVHSAMYVVRVTRGYPQLDCAMKGHKRVQHEHLYRTITIN